MSESDRPVWVKAGTYRVVMSHIRRILKGEKHSVTDSADPIKQVFSGAEPPAPGRVGAARGGYDE